MQASEAVEGTLRPAVLSPGRGREHVTLVKTYHVLHVNTEEVKKNRKEKGNAAWFVAPASPS